MEKIIIFISFLFGCNTVDRTPPGLPPPVVHETTSKIVSEEEYHKILTDSTYFHINNDLVFGTEITTIELSDFTELIVP